MRTLPALLILPALTLPAFTRAQTTAAGPHFEAASIKPNTSASPTPTLRPPVGGRITLSNFSLKDLIGFAWSVHDFQIDGGPVWLGSSRYDVTAKALEANTPFDQLQRMLRALLQERFQLALHQSTKDVQTYALVPGKSGLHVPEPEEGNCGARPLPVCGTFTMHPNQLEGRRTTMTQLAAMLSNILDRPVMDKTSYTAPFDVHLEFSREIGDADTSLPSIFTALQDQLGLKLESQKAPGEILVIDHAEKPGEN